MKKRYLPMASLLIAGILGASGSANATLIDHTISGANITEIARIAEKNIQINDLGIIADDNAIDEAILAEDITGIQIERSEISNNISLIALGNIIDTDIQAIWIDAGITNISA